MRLLQPEDAEYRACVALFGPAWAEKWARRLTWTEKDTKALGLAALVRDDDGDRDLFDSWTSTLSRWARDQVSGWKAMVETRPPASLAEHYFSQPAKKSAEGNPYFGNAAHQQMEEHQARQEEKARRVSDAIARMFRGE